MLINIIFVYFLYKIHSLYLIQMPRSSFLGRTLDMEYEKGMDTELDVNENVQPTNRDPQCDSTWRFVL